MKLKKWFCFDIWCFKSQVLQILVVEPYTFIPGTLRNLGPGKTRFLGVQVSWPSYFWFSKKLKCSNVRFSVGFLFLKTFLHKEISMSKTQFSGNDQNMSEIFARLSKEFLYNHCFVTKIGAIAPGTHFSKGFSSKSLLKCWKKSGASPLDPANALYVNRLRRITSRCVLAQVPQEPFDLHTSRTSISLRSV